jgi:hypothetical protein
MPLLSKRRDEVKHHWHAAASALGDILPGSAKSYRPFFEEPAGTTATLVCQRFHSETALRDTGLRIPIVPLIESASSESPTYWMSWYEQWSPEIRASSNKLRFHSSSITIFKGVQDAPKLQLFRAEWSGVQKVEKQKDIFQGNGAAHPHWHFDALRSYLENTGRQLARAEQHPENARVAAADEVRDFGDVPLEQEVASSFRPVDYSPSANELDWTAIHLANDARWSEQAWPGPEGPHDVHARGPESPDALRRWLSSCVRYVQAEINKT